MNMDQVHHHHQKILLSYNLNPAIICTQQQLPEGEKKVVKRRRRKSRREEGKNNKRKLSEEQADFLEKSFRKEKKLESGRKVRLAAEIGLDPKQVAVWFQNRRARWKSKQLEEEYMRLKSEHDTTVIEKCHLEAEVLKLKEELSEAQKEVGKLSGGSNGFSCACGGGDQLSSSPSTSYSMDTNQVLLGELGHGGEDELVFFDESFAYYANMMDWVNNLHGM